MLKIKYRLPVLNFQHFSVTQPFTLQPTATTHVCHEADESSIARRGDMDGGSTVHKRGDNTPQGIAETLTVNAIIGRNVHYVQNGTG